MKLITKTLCGLLILGGFISVFSLLHAQETATPVQSAAPDSIVQLTAESQGLNLVSSGDLPELGTFWVVDTNGVSAPWPCPPRDTNLPIYGVADGQFLVDMTGGKVATDEQQSISDALAALATSVVNLIGQIQEPQASRTLTAGGRMQTMAMSSLSPDDGGDLSDTNSIEALSSFTSQALVSSTNLWLAITNLANNTAYLMLSNTIADVQYEIQGVANLSDTNWISEGSVFGSELTNWTPTSVAATNKPTLFLRARSWVSSDGSGLPDWWELLYFGHTGVDPNDDPKGDGWSNIQKFQNGWNPNVFYTPPAPQGLTATYNAVTSTANISWLPSPGAVTGYILTTPNSTNYLSASVTGYADLDPNLAADLTPDEIDDVSPVTFQLEASYVGGNSAASTVALAPYFPGIWLVQGAQGSNFLAVSALSPGTKAIRLTREDSYAEAYYGDYSYNASNTIPLTSFTNGLYYIPPGLFTAPIDAYGNGNYVWWAQTVNANGGANCQGIGLGANSVNVNYGVDAINPLYSDGRAQMKQDLIFQLRAAMVDYTFAYYSGNPGDEQFEYVYPTNYVYSGFYQMFNQYGQQQATGTFDPFLPFENNYFYRNFVFNLTNVNQGNLTSGIWGGYTPYLYISNSPVAYQFQPPTTSGSTISSLLSTNDARWLGTGTYDAGSTWPYSPISEIGMSLDGSGYYHLGGNNYFGLPFVSVDIAYASGSGTATTTLNAGSSTAQGGYFYVQPAQPQFQTVAYNFWNPNPPYGITTVSLPGTTGFTQTNLSDLFIVPVRGTISVVGYAKLSLQNGYSGVYGYLGQYFDKAYQITNSIVTTNTTGILSPYGSFFATQPGPAALVTMPDLDTGARGTCTVYAVSINFDANHDGMVDTSFNGPDQTSPNNPYVFWVNNNYDRWLYDADDSTNYEDGLNSIEVANTVSTDERVPDCHYGEYYGARMIPTTRDLQDFARLWVSGITTNLLAALPSGSTVTLNWGDVGSPNPNNPTIDLFAAADADGGIGYLTNSTSAANQINPITAPFIQRLAPGGSIQLNTIVFANNWAGNHFIWCGVTNGSGQLNLTISDGNGNVLAQASQWIQVVDIKQMYERWTVGDNAKKLPLIVAIKASNDLSTNPVVQPFQYPVPADTNTPYILFVHGWNMTTDDKDHFAETAFKRLYWQGYQGRFGSYRWPTDNGFNGTLLQLASSPSEKNNFDRSEYQAWQSGQGLLNKLTDLNTEYPNHVYVLAHSMGNIVVGEALRLEATNKVVNTYVASQAAVSAHTYDPTVLAYSFYYSYLGVPISTAPKTPNIYGGWFAADDGFAAGKIVSFYNTNDYALQRSVWQLNQLLKPDQFVFQGNAFWNYGYSGSTNDAQPWNHFYKVNSDTYAVINLDIVNVLTNHYEAMAFAAQSYTTALGATSGTLNNLFQNIDLTRVSNPIWPPDPTGKNYAEHFWHSAEFRGNNIMARGYWGELLGNQAFNLK